MIKFKLLFSVLFLLAVVAKAQEICDNGIDDDGDGFIDCFDPDCANYSGCNGFYIGNDVSCEAEPSEFPKFSLTLDFASPNKTANHLGRIAVGDLDNDGTPEIVSQNYYTGELFILNGNDGSVKYEAGVTGGAYPEWRVAIANIDGDDCAEIFTVLSEWDSGDRRTYYYIAAYDCQLNELWRSERRDRDPVHLSLADFDGDGQVELYYKDEIRDAKTGTRLVASANSNAWNSVNGGPVAVDVMGDGDLELVSGCTIYEVNLGSRTADAGSLNVLASRSEYGIKKPENSTSIADYNLDGYLDVIATGKDNDGVTTVFFWDVHNDVLRTFSDPIPVVDEIPLNCSASSGTDSYAKGWIRGTGRLNIGDLDGDGNLNVSFVSGRFLYALDENFNLLWRVVVNEETSGHTGCTLFDFNGDGKTEVVYRDEQWLYIINGTDGSVFTQIRCISRTNVEYPIVADVDADGSTELCLVCGTDDVASWDNFCQLSYSENSQVRVYKSNGEPWVPARRLWNQHGYFNVNVNDDLTIPKHQQKHHLIWSTGTCTTGPNRPLNNFLNQSPFLNSQGCPTYASPDLSFVDNSLTINQPSCPDLDFTISFQIQNLGDVEITGDVPISFYDGNPLQAGATKLGTKYVTLNHFKVGEKLAINNATISGPGSPFTLYMVLNDNGSTVPTPISMPNTDFLECDYNDNILSGLVDPLPFALSTETTDNITCAGNTVPPSGSARAFRLVGGTEVTTDYIFNWFNGPTASGTPDFQGAVYSGLAAGTYTVFATHKTAFCNSDTVQVTINDASKNISAEIVREIDYTNCKAPNGKLRVIVNGGEPTGNFTYEWYEGNTVGGGLIISKSHVATDLKPIVYTVLVTEKASGCQTVKSLDVLDKSVTPVVTASATDISCSNSNSGVVNADVGGVTSGYTFSWYKGNNVKPTPDFTGSTVNNLAKGNYTVVAMNNSTKCESAPVTVTINKTTPPVVTAAKGTDNSSCDSSAPNGTASANVSGSTSGFTFEWFAGQNTLPGNSVGSGSSITGLAAGTYTVKATDNNTGCSGTAEVTILKKIVIPAITVNKTDVTQCAPFDGSVTATVSVGSPSDYTFSWYDGSTVKATPDYSETGNILSQLGPGTYTVEAVNNTTHCIASAKTVTIVAPVIEIELDGSASSFPADCSMNSGILTVNVLPSTDPYLVEWYKGNVDPATATSFFSQSGLTSSTATGLTSGNYTVRATNLNTGCEATGVFYMPLADSHQLDLINTTAANTCVDNNGSIEVQLTPTSLAGFDESDYLIKLYSGTSVSGAAQDTKNGVAGTSNYTFTGLASGTYVVTATPIPSAIAVCDDPVVLATVDLEVEYPDITAVSSTANTFCDEFGATPNGGLVIDINSGANPADFIIEWFSGQDTSTPLNPANISADKETVSNLAAGYYTVSVTDNVTYTTCATTRTFQVVDDKPVVTIPSASVSINHVSSCAANNGSLVTISDITENGSSVGLANYTFEWYDASNNLLPGNTNQLSNVPAGTYYVKAISTVNSCQTTMLEFEIEDQTIGDPAIDLVSFQNPTKCLQPGNVLGELHINANGSSTMGYTYSWYSGNAASGPVLDSDADLTGQVAGTYTVEVVNNSTQCSAQETYTLILEQSDVPITASASPLTNCATDDGSLFATVTNGYSNNYDYNWSVGTSVASPEDFNGKNVAGLVAGDYTVQAVDQADATCKSAPVTVTITNDQIMPNLSVVQRSPLTVCDLTRADGSAMATVDGGFIGYTFDWYEGTTATGTPVYTGSEFFGMEAKTYTVVATNNISQCSSTQQITIEEDITPMPDPTIEVLSNVTSCIDDNGALSASVNGNTKDYIFNWYIGQQVGATPDFTGEIFTDRPVGFYTVTATSRITGCVSGPATAEIIEDLNYPEFEFVIGNASCDQNNGYVRLIMTNNVEVESIVWDVNGSTVEGPNLSEVPVGVYTVTVTTALGCSVTEDVEVKTEINPYNGISRNGDGANEFFKIQCIENYPDNIVKIFNRAGTQVFEAEGYDNATTYFDGVSNKGISVMGDNLPDGTYFYIIDKRDGSKPLAGYLEIVK